MNNYRSYDHSIRKGLAAILVFSGLGTAPMMACHSALSSGPAEIRHLAMAGRPGNELYVDRVSNRSVMKENEDSGASTVFCSFLVGWKDSTIRTDDKQKRDKEKYFQYDMQKGWVALVNGDSLYPVFFQERPGLNEQLKEAVMVFELPKNARADTLVYKDSFGNWGGAALCT